MQLIERTATLFLVGFTANPTGNANILKPDDEQRRRLCVPETRLPLKTPITAPRRSGDGRVGRDSALWPFESDSLSTGF